MARCRSWIQMSTPCRTTALVPSGESVTSRYRPCSALVRSTAPSRPTHATRHLGRVGGRVDGRAASRHRQPGAGFVLDVEVDVVEHGRVGAGANRVRRVERGGPDSSGQVPDQDATGRTLADVEDRRVPPRPGHDIPPLAGVRGRKSAAPLFWPQTWNRKSAASGNPLRVGVSVALARAVWLGQRLGRATRRREPASDPSPGWACRRWCRRRSTSRRTQWPHRPPGSACRPPPPP